MKIDMWHRDEFVKGKYYADASFYPHGSFGYSYRGNIYDEAGKIIGDYACNDSIEIDNAFIIDWGK